MPVGAFLENSVILGFIFPGVTIIVLAGYVARVTEMPLAPIILLAALGSFAGDNSDYFLGRKGGGLLSNKPLFAHSIRLVSPFLEKYGIWAVFVGRFSGWSRAWVALVSGVSRFTYWKFAIVSALSACVWTSVWIVGGYLLGGNKKLIEEWLSRLSLLGWFVFAVIITYYFRTRIKLVADLIVFSSKKYGRRIRDKF